MNCSLYGLTVVQTFRYARLYPSDRPLLKILVSHSSCFQLFVPIAVLTVRNQVLAILYA